MEFGERIFTGRRKMRLTQRKLAEQVGVDFTYISKIENGKLEQPPSEELIRKIATAIGDNPEELLDLAGKFDPEEVRKTASDVPEVGVLLRRLQSPEFARKHRDAINKMLEENDRKDADDSR